MRKFPQRLSRLQVRRENDLFVGAFESEAKPYTAHQDQSRPQTYSCLRCFRCLKHSQDTERETAASFNYCVMMLSLSELRTRFHVQEINTPYGFYLKT